MFADLPTDAIADGLLSWEDAEVQDHITHLDRECEWYEDSKGFLYIVDPEADDLIHGPDNDTADAMYCAIMDDAPLYRLEEYVDGMVYVHHVLRRFNTVDGFYHA